MVMHCAAYGCNNQQRKGDKTYSFHRFPHNCPEILSKWIIAVRRKNWKPTEYSRLCSKHFTDDCYQVRPGAKRKLLKEDAVPSIFDFPTHLIKKKSSRRILVRSALDSSTSTIAQNERSQAVDMRGNDTSNGSSAVQPSTIVALRKKVKTLQQKLRRRKMKIQSTNDLFDHLRTSKCTTYDLQKILENNFSGLPLELLMQLLKNPKHPSGRRYSPLIKEFALTLYFHSPKAFKYVRQFLQLPHPSIIKKWLSSVKCHPGLLGEVFNYLKQEIDNMPHVRNCSLIFDSMSIRKQISYNASLDKKMGYVDLGGIANADAKGLATEALVFMIVSLNGNFKCPIAYFFINKISSILQAQITKVCLEKLNEIGITIHSLTCDGAVVNIQTLKRLGCNLCTENLDSFKSSFKHPVTGTDVAVFLDPCHMLKLARNTLSDKKVITSEIGDVKWEYIVKLNRLQEQEHLKIRNKLSGAHVYYWNKKQNVKLAAQTLSSSVANALEYLLKMKHPDFQGCEATIKFIRILDQLFDILNTRNPFGKGFKEPLKIKNKKHLDDIFEQIIKYLISLSVNGTAIMLHPRKTFVLGFAMCIKSAQLLMTKLLEENCNIWKYLLLYKVSQDNLEIFFSCIRARGGNNNNPSVDQFRWALRKLLFCKNMCIGNTNCTNYNSMQYSIFEFRSIQRCVYNNDSMLSNDSDNALSTDVQSRRRVGRRPCADRLIVGVTE